MSATTQSAMDQTRRSSWERCGSNAEQRGRWTPPNTIATVLGFVFFWPIGLFILFWVLSGRHVRELPDAAREGWSTLKGVRGSGPGEHRRSDNVVFDDYQRTQFDRIREIRDEIVARAQRFNAFRSDAKRREDQDEFDRFMASTPERGDA